MKQLCQQSSLTVKQCSRGAQAVKFLSGHHSKPHYKVPAGIATLVGSGAAGLSMSWNQNWNARSKRSKRNNGGSDKQPKETSKFPLYDNATVTTSGSSSSGALPGALSPQVLSLLQNLASKDSNTAAALEGMLPNPEKEDLRLKQRHLNNIRKCQQKVERKEQALAKRELQMQTFLEEVKAHIASEKQRHKTDVETLQAELAEAKVALQAAKEGKDVPMTEMDEIENMLSTDTEAAKENNALKTQIQAMEIERNQQQQQMYHMKQQMEEMMRHLTAHSPGTEGIAPAAGGLAASIAGGTPMNGEDAENVSTPRRKSALVPFRAGRTKRPSPYGQEKDLGCMDGWSFSLRFAMHLVTLLHGFGVCRGITWCLLILLMACRLEGVFLPASRYRTILTWMGESPDVPTLQNMGTLFGTSGTTKLLLEFVPYWEAFVRIVPLWDH